MTIQELYAEIHKLNRDDKWRILQWVANDLATEEQSTPFDPNAVYPIHTVFGMEDAARELHRLFLANNEDTGELK